MLRHSTGSLIKRFVRSYSSTSFAKMKGLVIGCRDGNGDEAVVSDIGSKLLQSSAEFSKQFDIVKSKLKQGKCRLIFTTIPEYPVVALTGLGPSSLGYNEAEERDDKREAIRNAVASGCSSLRDAGCLEIEVDPCGDAEAAAEGANLSLFVFDAHKSEKKEKPVVKMASATPADDEAWSRGTVKASGQNIARFLTESPANHMTPTIFAGEAKKHLEPLGVKVEAHDKAWAEGMKMGSFLSVARGSDEPCVFLEMTYNGGKAGDAPVALVGKGITFDSGGISLKVPSAIMNDMRADMGGGAVVVGTLYILAALKVPINVKGFVPLTENMPSGKATKVADVVYAMNGKSIQIMNTDAEGRLVLADALCYADTFKPSVVVDIATLTGSMVMALGSGACGVFCRSKSDWLSLEAAGAHTGDRVWRMPLWEHYRKAMDEARLSDLCNVGSHGRSAGSCTAAAFLSNFTTCPRWTHMDKAGVMDHEGKKDGMGYIKKGCTGRPTRTLALYVEKLAGQN